MYKLLLSGLLILSLSACQSYKYGSEGPTEKSNLTMGVVKSRIIKGETTQDEILKLFGSPNLVSKNKSNREVWSYNKMSVEQKAGSTDFFAGQRASQSSSSRSFDLIITFDEKDIVADYSVISTAF
ncbi:MULTISPECIES: hypothetical protein [Sphingobacterium]|uniref:Lipoprotein SmpA/OmlA domain-containing protein n=2 Tax=Sphingobacterium TaxID=28453 RepID=A0A2X2IYM9_SPHMU|nr:MULTISPECIES: hypothetical protein [Sphingobacterium]QRQ60625.1 hypothetical protein I6J33_21280 [Sphingobacterium multivorum]TWI22683.1 hypothetical protein IQ31_01365 [Sphingobacterium siyangense]SPZ87267.1 Uncharacterised protein [Sphingobacterium multivorum]HAL50901.1 hypothetical protein [Sphingobacterium sp.]